MIENPEDGGTFIYELEHISDIDDLCREIRKISAKCGTGTKVTVTFDT